MSPVDGTTRHFVGAEQPNAPPHPATLPPASELLGDPPEDVDGGPEEEPRPPIGDDIRGGFDAWLDAAGLKGELGTVAAARLFRAFQAGVDWQRQQTAPRAPELPLEGTVESRTIIAALEMFKEQVLAHNPEEVKLGEWLNARDVDVLIQGIRANAAKGR